MPRQYQYMSKYEFRLFKPLAAQPHRFDQFDLYFFKPGTRGVGVKARFRGSFPPSEFWLVQDIECKFLKPSENPTLQRWKKVHSEAQFKVFGRQYIRHCPHQFGCDQEEQAIRQHLRQLSRQIAEALRKIVKEKHYIQNPDLKSWLSEEEPVAEVFIIQKTKIKTSAGQKGLVRVSGLFGPARSAFETRGWEGKRPDQVIKRIGEREAEGPNCSYPDLLEELFGETKRR